MLCTHRDELGPPDSLVLVHVHGALPDPQAVGVRGHVSHDARECAEAGIGVFADAQHTGAGAL